MGRLPVLSGADAVQIFGKAGWTVDRQRGSHVVLVKDGHIATLSVPDHKELARGTLRSLIRAAGMTTEDFESLAKDEALVFRALVYWEKTLVSGGCRPPHLVHSRTSDRGTTISYFTT